MPSIRVSTRFTAANDHELDAELFRVFPEKPGTINPRKLARKLAPAAVVRLLRFFR
jgi:hypothetical protein